MIENLLKNKNAKQKAQIKSQELAKVKFSNAFTKDGIKIKIVRDIEIIDGGIQLFAQAWKDGKQLGFGKDGSVEIERFRIFKPPVLVDDINGDIIREWEEEDLETGKIIKKQRRLRFDPTEAIKQDLAHTINQVGKDGKNIIKGKIGNTTSTFYPSAGAVSPVDGRIYYDSTTSWANSRAGATGGGVDVISANTVVVQSEQASAVSYPISRNAFLFDTSPIGTDTVDSGTFSLYSSATGNDTETTNPADLALVSSSPATNDNLVTADYDITNWGSTRYATDFDLGTFIATTGYKDMTLNASGIAFVNTTGITKFGIRGANDVDNVAPTARSYGMAYYADQTGTTQDPKLVVVHSAAASTFVPKVMMF
jgi:hypothetical protein